MDVLQHVAVAARLVVADGAEQANQWPEKPLRLVTKGPEETLSLMVKKFVTEFDASRLVSCELPKVHTWKQYLQVAGVVAQNRAAADVDGVAMRLFASRSADQDLTAEQVPGRGCSSF